jgi:Sulfotransferase family
MAIVSDRYNLIFIMNPRTGCTATSEMMLQKMDGYWAPAENILDQNGKIKVQSKHTTAKELRAYRLVPADKLDSYTVFTTVRNPFDSIVSLWTKKRYKYVGAKRTNPKSIVNQIKGYDQDMDFIQNHTFSEWVIEVLGRRKNLTVNTKHVVGTNHVLHFETLQGDFNTMLHDLDITEKFTIEAINKTKNREPEYRQYYDDDARQLLEDKLASELKEFGYLF